MDSIKETAYEVLSIVERIYEKQASENPTAIMGKKTFQIKTENGREVIVPKYNYEKTDSSYYFETPKMDDQLSQKKIKMTLMIQSRFKK